MDYAGYSDVIEYGYSLEHPYTYHELLSGEWGAAIYYDGIKDAHKAMWLTDKFLFPNWTTNSNFFIAENPGVQVGAWHNPDNPTPLNNTGRSVIENAQVRIQIDYEVVDLEFLDPNIYPVRSPLAVRDEAAGKAGLVRSDRYIMLQTYTIANKIDGTIENLEFYQMLHGHGADDYGPVVSSIYDDFTYPDPLEYYIPYNPIHLVGNFRFDITQWNDPNHPDSLPNSIPHKDYVGFSCAVEPNVIENGFYEGHSGEPVNGTHINIENRSLNGEFDSFGEAAGACGWYLSALDPCESVSVTIAFMFSHGEPAFPALELLKQDNVEPNDGIAPADYIIYTITLVPDANDHTGVRVVDYLPKEVDFVSAAPADPNYGYDPNERSYTWYIGDLAADDPCNIYLQLTVQVNQRAAPAGAIINYAKLISDVGYNIANESTPVCCWSDIIYVDQSALGLNNGSGWLDAFTDLNDALDLAGVGCAKKIYVAQGTYQPGSQSSDSFIIPLGLALYGGFPAGGSALQQRRWLNYETILSGAIGPNNFSQIVVLISDANDVPIADADLPAVLDGFIVADGQYGLYCSGGAPVITHNRFYNLDYGIYCVNSSAPTITNNLIYDNSTCGLYLDYPDPNTVIRNNTIAYNLADGVIKNGATPEPNTVLINCIIWENARCQIIGCASGYSCVQDKINDPNGANVSPDANGNITAYPRFVDSDNRDFHLEPNSPCIEAGDPDSACELESDIDGQWRIIDYYIDMGADEYCPGDDSNPADFNADGAVDLLDYAELAAVWLLDNSDPLWNDKYDLFADAVINLPDLDAFGQNWLWLACWNDSYMSSSFGEGMMMDMDMGMSMLSPPQVLTSTDDYQTPVELTFQQQIQRLEDNITFLQEVWQTSPDIRAAFTEDDWSAWIESLAEQLGELEND